MAKFICFGLPKDGDVMVNIDKILCIQKERNTGFATIIMSDTIKYPTEILYDDIITLEGLDPINMPKA